MGGRPSWRNGSCLGSLALWLGIAVLRLLRGRRGWMSRSIDLGLLVWEMGDRGEGGEGGENGENGGKECEGYMARTLD